MPHTEPAAYRAAVEAALATGWRFAGLHASGNGSLIRALLVDLTGATRLETLATPDRKAVSLVDLAAAADWDEREAFDCYGVTFPGHEPLRPLINHETTLAAWTVPVDGRDPHQVAVGPIHAGVIESGHFRFHVVGDLILQLDARLFYKHRGLERAAEGRTLEQGAAFVARACAACAVANSVAYAHACEERARARAAPELARARTILLELERTWNHLNDIAAACAGTGLAAGNAHFAALTERARRLNGQLTGHRFLFDTIRIGGSELELGPDHVQGAREELATLRGQAELGWRSLLDNVSFQDRLAEVGILTAETARGSDPSAPPSERPASPRTPARALHVSPTESSKQPSEIPPRATCAPASSSGCSSSVRHSTLLESLLEHPIRPVAATNGGPERPIGIGRVESPRGETSCIVERNGNHIERVRLRTGSYANWPSVTAAAAGNLLPDFPLINKSFELCYACVDR